MKIFSLLLFLLLLPLLATRGGQSTYPAPGPGRQAYGAPFTPPAPGSLKLWLSADCITLSGSSCSVPSNGTTSFTWDDRSGNGNNATINAGTCTFNTNQLNSLPAVTFASTCNFSFVNTLASGYNNTFLGVILTTPGGHGGLILGSPLSTYTWTADDNIGSLPMQYSDTQNIANVCNSNAVGTAAWHQMDLTIINASSCTFRYSQTADNVVTFVSSEVLGAPNRLGVNGYTHNTQYFQGQMAEVFWYNTNLTLAQTQTIEAYLHSKWGV